ncbi:serpentine type 7TM GPCR chemoreceptor srt domain-containing protein [Ditylenchus destructor]|uniref:Serpentine type 7TM GPCR chemoreceptor srt domain-containing protein n=1 Tax=Ditylenchus destructor TaxID=166010 RepID=A0AAD4MP76_9BILA|nr:serpentine type 7TM GPCR chemoreceptor srt domain-containing protein [Ditylenchus destructor]
MSVMDLEQNTEEIVWTRTGAPIAERLTIGVAYVILAMIFLILQISILIVFLKYKDYRCNICYRIMTAISIADSTQLLIHVYGGFITIFNTSFSALAEKILGGISNSICITLLPFGFILALNRLMVFKRQGLEPSTEGILFNSLIFLSCLWGFGFLCTYMTPYCGIAFRDYAWNYDETLVWTEKVQFVDEMTTIPMLGGTFVIYLVVLVVLVINRHETRKVTGNQTFQPSYKFLSPVELRLLLQSLVHFLMCASLLLVWHLQFAILPESPYSIAAVNYHWILYNGTNPLLYLSMNSSIRRRVLTLWGKRRPDGFLFTQSGVNTIGDKSTNHLFFSTAQSRPRTAMP